MQVLFSKIAKKFSYATFLCLKRSKTYLLHCFAQFDNIVRKYAAAKEREQTEVDPASGESASPCDGMFAGALYKADLMRWVHDGYQPGWNRGKQSLFVPEG